jgi:hypothetical protein
MPRFLISALLVVPSSMLYFSVAPMFITASDMSIATANGAAASHPRQG